MNSKFPYVVQCPAGKGRQILIWLWKNIGKSAIMDPENAYWVFETKDNGLLVKFKTQEDSVLFKMIWL